MRIKFLKLMTCFLFISAFFSENAWSQQKVRRNVSTKTRKFVLPPDSPNPHGAIPTEHQVNWQRLEYYAFVHFGLNTFTGKEWGYGDENPQIFNPENFNAEEIIKTFKDAGMTGIIYTAKHHDGFCAWQTKSTEHNITKTPWKNGKGDVVKEFSDACKKYGLKFGTYLSPWDRNHKDYGRDGYIKSYYKQIEELLTNYGGIFEIWFDGARGGDGFYGGTRESRDIGNADTYYNFEQVVKNIRKIQPKTIIWGASHYGDARWGGSEKGHVNYPHWATIDSARGGGGGTGFRGGDRWVPAEGDTTINHAGWFWHEGQTSKVKSPEELLQVWFDCVGRGANLILNVAPDKSGKLDSADVKSLLEFKKLRDRLYAIDFAKNSKAVASDVRKNNLKSFGPQNLFDDNPDTFWSVDDENLTPSVEITLKRKSTFDVIKISEQIRLGQRVDGWAVDAKISGKWEEILQGASIGNQAMLKLKESVTTNELRLRITKSSSTPVISGFSLFRQPAILEKPEILKNSEGKIILSTKSNAPIRFTTNGSDPSLKSLLYKTPFFLSSGGVIKACSIVGKELSSIAIRSFGLSKDKWKVEKGDGENIAATFDENPKTHWICEGNNQSFIINLGENVVFRGFSYLPRQDNSIKKMTDRFIFEISENGNTWKKISEGEFGNLKANPIEQIMYFKKREKARFIRFTSVNSLNGKGGSVAEISILP